MDKVAIENEARRLQVEMYGRRELRYPMGVPGIPTLFDPRNVAEHCELVYEERDRLQTDFARGGEAAGLWQRDRSTVLVSRRYSSACLLMPRNRGVHRAVRRQAPVGPDRSGGVAFEAR